MKYNCQLSALLRVLYFTVRFFCIFFIYYLQKHHLCLILTDYHLPFYFYILSCCLKTCESQNKKLIRVLYFESYIFFIYYLLSPESSSSISSRNGSLKSVTSIGSRSLPPSYQEFQAESPLTYDDGKKWFLPSKHIMLF